MTNLSRQQIFNLIFFTLLVPVGVYYYRHTQYPYYDTLLPVIFGVISVLCAVVLFFVYSRRGLDRKKEAAVTQKIQTLINAGHELHVNREDVLTTQDVDVLNKYIRQTLLLVTVVCGVLGLAFLIFSEGIGRMLGAALLVAIYPLRNHMKKDIIRVINEGKKQIIRGIITDRHTTTTGTRDSRTTNHWLTIGEIKLLVARSTYDYYLVGDAAEFHTVEYPKGTTFILKDEKLNGAGLQ